MLKQTLLTFSGDLHSTLFFAESNGVESRYMTKDQLDYSDLPTFFVCLYFGTSTAKVSTKSEHETTLERTSQNLPISCENNPRATELDRNLQTSDMIMTHNNEDRSAGEILRGRPERHSREIVSTTCL